MWHIEYGLYKTAFYGTTQCRINSDDGTLQLPRSGVSNQAQQHTLQCARMRITTKASLTVKCTGEHNAPSIGKMPFFTPARLHTQDDTLGAAAAA